MCTATTANSFLSNKSNDVLSSSIFVIYVDKKMFREHIINISVLLLEDNKFQIEGGC